MIELSREVRTRSAAAQPVVALETTLVAHGFPEGEGLAVGLESAQAVRDAGAVPATVGVLDGALRIGLSDSELERFTADARKVGPRDLAAAIVQGAVGATTVGGTLAACRAAGIGFLGTGGIGGVHRGNRMDISADLGELARTEALVVSSGIKSLLDVPATMELLESLGIPVVGLQDGRPAALLHRPRRPTAAGTSRERRRGGRARAHPLAPQAPLGAATRPAAAREHRRRRAADRGSARSSRRAGRHGAGGDAVRPRPPARAKRRPNAPRQPRARDRERAARSRGRGRLPGRVAGGRITPPPEALLLQLRRRRPGEPVWPPDTGYAARSSTKDRYLSRRQLPRRPLFLRAR